VEEGRNEEERKELVSQVRKLAKCLSPWRICSATAFNTVEWKTSAYEGFELLFSAQTSYLREWLGDFPPEIRHTIYQKISRCDEQVHAILVGETRRLLGSLSDYKSLVVRQGGFSIG
jgi:hypothetical protein